MSTQVITPIFKWAQNRENVFVTIEVSDVKDCVVTFEDQKLFFKGTAGNGSHYELDLELKHPIDPAQSRYKKSERLVEIYLFKKEPGPFWDNVAADPKKHKAHMRVDWDKWKEEDDESYDSKMDFNALEGLNFGNGMGNFDMSQFGAGAMGNDSDDEEGEDLADLNPGAPGHNEEEEGQDETAGHHHS